MRTDASMSILKVAAEAGASTLSLAVPKSHLTSVVY